MTSAIRFPLLGLRLLRPHVGPSVLPYRSITSEGAKEVLSSRTRIDVGETYMSYLDTAAAAAPTAAKDRTVLFLHGNPTAAYLWRNIIPHVQDLSRCVAPDLIGQGHSGKEPHNQYRFRDHYKYLSEWIDMMHFPGKLNLVIHDWGSALGFHWANQHRERVESITFMEAIVAPVPSWDAWPEFARQHFLDMRSSAGEEMVLQNNFFLETLFPSSILRELSEEEMEEYRRPFKQPGEDRRPTLTWPREIPVRGEGPQDTVDNADAYRAWLSTSIDLPKLYIDAQPGFFAPAIRELVTDWPNLKVAEAPGLHFMQEDSPDEIGQAIHAFLADTVFK